MSLRFVTSMLPGERRLGRWLVGTAVSLQVALAILPIIVPGHLAFARHRHRLNPTSHLFEDVLVLGDDAARERALPPADRPVLRDEGQKVLYLTCLISNLTLLHYTAPRDSASVAVPRVEVVDRGLPGRERALGSLSSVRVAPKQSPPLSA